MAFNIRVPASSANLGPGFDSVGVALNRYLVLHVQENETWRFSHHSTLLGECPPYEKHLIYQIAAQIADTHSTALPPHHVAVSSEIPFARGLGSSASAVLAGIELANQVCRLALSDDEKLQRATEIEGHPDNVAASLFGGLIIAAAVGDKVLDYVRLSALKNVQTILYIPDVELKTADARNILPQQLSRTEAVNASAISNVVIASLLTGDFKKAGRWMEKDVFHEPYRAKLLPDYDKIKQEAKCSGAYATVISGAGPSMLSLIPTAKAKTITEHMSRLLPGYEVASIPINQTGMVVARTDPYKR